MALHGLLEKTSDANLPREMIGFAAHGAMELEVAGLTGAAPGEPRESRINQRVGYREGDWQTSAGTVELRIPKLRRGSGVAPLPSTVGEYPSAILGHGSGFAFDGREVGPMAERLRGKGVASQAALALSDKGVPTPRGQGTWTHTIVARVLARAR